MKAQLCHAFGRYQLIVDGIGIATTNDPQTLKVLRHVESCVNACDELPEVLENLKVIQNRISKLKEKLART